MGRIEETHARTWALSHTHARARTHTHTSSDTYTEANPSTGLHSDMTLGEENNSITISRACKMSNFWFKCMGESRGGKFMCFGLPGIDDRFSFNKNFNWTPTGTLKLFPMFIKFRCRIRWSPGLRQELSSLTRMLRSCVRILLKAWMSVCVYSLFVLFCVQIADLRLADPQSKESYRLCIGLRNWKSGQGPTKGL
jgi:hypothetical protein